MSTPITHQSLFDTFVSITRLNNCDGNTPLEFTIQNVSGTSIDDSEVLYELNVSPKNTGAITTLRRNASESSGLKSNFSLSYQCQLHLLLQLIENVFTEQPEIGKCISNNVWTSYQKKLADTCTVPIMPFQQVLTVSTLDELTALTIEKSRTEVSEEFSQKMKAFKKSSATFSQIFRRFSNEINVTHHLRGKAAYNADVRSYYTVLYVHNSKHHSQHDSERVQKFLVGSGEVVNGIEKELGVAFLSVIKRSCPEIKWNELTIKDLHIINKFKEVFTNLPECIRENLKNDGSFKGSMQTIDLTEEIREYSITQCEPAKIKMYEIAGENYHCSVTTYNDVPRQHVKFEYSDNGSKINFDSSGSSFDDFMPHFLLFLNQSVAFHEPSTTQNAVKVLTSIFNQQIVFLILAKMYGIRNGFMVKNPHKTPNADRTPVYWDFVDANGSHNQVEQKSLANTTFELNIQDGKHLVVSYTCLLSFSVISLNNGAGPDVQLFSAEDQCGQAIMKSIFLIDIEKAGLGEVELQVKETTLAMEGKMDVSIVKDE